MKLLQLISCILLPPLGVFLTVGVGSALIINILLTLLGLVPGIIHAVWIYSKQSEKEVNV
ncbi:YqaE/Pmp3 family membrane protein [Pleurocapsales cyanobacterium LEGE 10410]|nr:YqaE/Pmp3 family membrane protein [Pleurocapsales cyanobacterium LEGE 10410]